jgi:SPP1 gp7 family putative phage head morphogenesis protein
VERTGWTFRGGSAWRANVVWDTNLRTSYAAGRYEQMQQVTTSRPYWQWRHGGSAHPRPQHLALNGKVFRFDDPFWSSFGSPPQGYGCRCSLFTLSDRDLERRGLAAEPGPQLGDRLPIPDLPGQTTAMNPPAGWGHLHGSSGLQHRAQLLDAVTRRLDPAIAAQVRAEAAARGIRLPSDAPQPQRPIVPLPEGVEIETERDAVIYRFEHNDGEDIVEFVVAQKPGSRPEDRIYTIGFEVNYSLAVEGNVENGAAIAAKIRTIMQHDATQREDGIRYATNAYVADNRGATRALLYAKGGFSAPDAQRNLETSLGDQYAVVQNGRMVPADKDGNPIPPDVYKQSVNQLRTDARYERQVRATEAEELRRIEQEQFGDD